MQYQEKGESLIMLENTINHSRDFKGIWIPKEIWFMKKLSPVEKILLAEIDSLDGENGCYASNEYFAEFLGFKAMESVSRMISKLKNMKLIYQESFDGKKRILRSLIHEGLTKKSRQTKPKSQGRLNQKVKADLTKKSTIYNVDNKDYNKVDKKDNNTPLNPPRGKRKSKKKILSIEEFKEFCESAFKDLGRLHMFELLLDNLVEFFDYRKQVIGSPIKSKMGVTKMVNKLAEESNCNHKQASRMIDQTIASEKWTGIYPVNGKQLKPEKEKKPDPYGEGDQNPYHNLF